MEKKLDEPRDKLLYESIEEYMKEFLPRKKFGRSFIRNFEDFWDAFLSNLCGEFSDEVLVEICLKIFGKLFEIYDEISRRKC